jgi:hypothetical protein
MRLAVGKTGKTGSGVRRVYPRMRGTRLAVNLKTSSYLSIRSTRHGDLATNARAPYPLTRLPVLSDGCQNARSGQLHTRTRGMHSPRNSRTENRTK